VEEEKEVAGAVVENRREKSAEAGETTAVRGKEERGLRGRRGLRRGWWLSITTHDSMEIVSCQILL
jgi:hypothetical protein